MDQTIIEDLRERVARLEADHGRRRGDNLTLRPPRAYMSSSWRHLDTARGRWHGICDATAGALGAIASVG